MNYLIDICERKRHELREQSIETSLATLAQDVHPNTLNVLEALRRTDRLQIIAEHKRRSPSKGRIRPDSDPAQIAKGYEDAGAAAISVLTDSAFDGCADDLRKAREAVSIPLLCKDFILSPMQVYQARSWGANIVLLIVAALKQDELHSLIQLVHQLGMEALVEVHDAHELSVALKNGARIVGVNNRNLHTFEVDLAVSETLAEHIPSDVVGVSESGIRNASDLVRITDAGYDAALIGEHFMRAPDPGHALKVLLQNCPKS
jgi:indole-3-glycerol phosphate synthase